MNYIFRKDSLYVGFLSYFIIISPLIRNLFGFLPYLFFFSFFVLFFFCKLIYSRNISYKLIVPLSICFFMLIFVVAKETSEVRDVYYTLLFFVSLGCSFWLVKQKKEFVKKAFLQSLVTYYFVFFFLMIMHGAAPSDINSYFPEVSRNYVSAMALILQVAYSASFYRCHNFLPKITPIFTLFISIVAYGRTGIGLSFLVLCVTVIEPVVRGRLLYKAFFGGLIIFTVLLVISFGEGMIEFINNKTNFKAGLDSPRSQMVQEYLYELDIDAIILGKNLSDISIINQYENNSHNSFIEGHSIYGITYILFLSWFLISITYYFVFFRFNYVYFSLLFILLVRFYFDKLALPGIFDYAFFYIYFIIVFDSRRRIKTTSRVISL